MGYPSSSHLGLVALKIFFFGAQPDLATWLEVLFILDILFDMDTP